MAVKVVLAAVGEDTADVGVAARAEQVVDSDRSRVLAARIHHKDLYMGGTESIPPALLVFSVPRERIGNNGYHRPHIWQT